MKNFLLPQKTFFAITLILIAMYLLLSSIGAIYAFTIISIWAMVSIFIAKNYSALGITTVFIAISMIVIFNLEPVLGFALFLIGLPLLIIFPIIGLVIGLAKDSNK